MKLVIKVLTSEQFSFNGKNYVKITGMVNDKQVCCVTVKEEFIPDSIEGKEVVLYYNIGFDSKFKPYLKLEEFAIN